MANDEEEQQQDPNAYHSDSDSNSDSDSDYPSGYDSYSDAPGDYDDDDDQKNTGFLNAFKFRRTDDDDKPLPPSKNNPEVNFRDFAEVLDGPRVKAVHDEDDPKFVADDDAFDFPEDPENWTEEDLREVWADGPTEIGGTGWDPAWATRDEWEYVLEELEDGREPPIAPFYLPYRKHYPAIPDNHFDINSPQSVIEELDRIEEFLKWVSYVFEDGSTYEGTLWDDYAHGKGVYVSKEGLVRYEGEWLQNDPEGHGVIEVDIPESEPAPGSKLEKKMRAQGKIFAWDFMSPEDREWLEKDIEDSYHLADGAYEIPFYENDAWVEEFGEKPEKGRYRYAGQWKHGRMHGCGVYSVNERLIYGRFYFGEYVDEGEGCDDETSALHAGIAEVAAAKARMFVNKPDGMVREQRGPYNDPQHPYFYEEEDVWMAPGFINQFYEVPDYWKTYVQEVDQEREMWLNSFYKAPLRLPMPAELEYWWANDKYHGTPEFVLINKEPEPDPEDPSRLIYTEDPLILHTPTGHLINYVEDEEHGIRLFWQPPLKKGEDVDPDKAHFLPLGYDEFFGNITEEKKESLWIRLLLAIENTCKPWFEKLDKWTGEQRQKIETRKKEIEEEIELIEAEVRLEEAIEQLDDLLRLREKEEEKKAEMGISDDEDEEKKVETWLPDEDEDEDDDDEEDEDEEDEEEKKVEKGSSTKDEKVTSVTKQDKKPTSVTKQDKKATPATKQDEKATPVTKQDKKTTPVTKQDKKATFETKQDKKATSVAKQDEKAPAEEEEDWDDEGDEEEEDEDNAAQSSFGSVEQEQTTDRQKGKPGKSPFSTSSLAFASCSLITAVPSKLQQSFSFWNKGRSKPELVPPLRADRLSNVKKVDSVSFRPVNGQKGSLKAVGQAHGRVKARSHSGGKFLEVLSLSKTRSRLLASADSKSNLKEPRTSGVAWLHLAPERDLDCILSLHSSMCNFAEHRETVR